MIKYYNGMDEVIHTSSKNHANFKINPKAKYAKINNGNNISNVDYIIPIRLANQKNKMHDAIDQKTRTLIDAGFLHNTITFSLSLKAQKNWLAIRVRKNDGTLPDPIDITTLDNDTYSLPSSEAIAFTDAAWATKEGHLDSGRVLKKSVYDAVGFPALKTIEDNR